MLMGTIGIVDAWVTLYICEWNSMELRILETFSNHQQMDANGT